jgi:alkanesulfonate monooxygenase SsuD/methylene tetrahydromethanopterin reductase-like flavin-dependent oxidoreductase (luciferase family)
MFGPTRTLEELPESARDLERLGFEEVWVVEDCFISGGLTAAATALAATSHVTVGIGLLPAAVRNVAIAAMEIGTLARLHPQRLRVAMGHGAEPWMRQIGARPPNRIKALEEIVTSARALLRGDTLRVDGDEVFLDAVRLDHPPRFAPPILLGTAGPRGVALAGEIADGLLLPEGSAPAAVRWAREALPPRANTTVYAWLRIDEDRDAAREVVAPTVYAWRDGGMYPTLVARSGISPAGELEPEEIDRVAVVGAPEDCARAIADLHRAGATSVVLVPMGAGPSEQLEWVAHDVLPLVLADSMSL